MCWFLISPCSGAYSDFISKFTDLLTPSLKPEPAFFRLLLYTIILWVLRRRFKGMSLVLCETARSSLTFGSSIDVLLSDHILSQYKELMLGFLSTSWWTQDWWHVPDIDLCTEKTINKHLNWLIQSCPPCLHQAFWLACCEKLKLFFNLIIPYKINYTAFDGFSTLITGLVNTRIRVKVSDGSTFVT